ncbi:hypothetical protein Smp_185450 [Schistosoma mansoni]|nr:hypothetical protein Smp_185450 [Schistosoma mansoni]|eukprot:XP_018644549.1 hypothetical protein Smp_185450 [Schistosoma mansoni]
MVLHEVEVVFSSYQTCQCSRCRDRRRPVLYWKAMLCLVSLQVL